MSLVLEVTAVLNSAHRLLECVPEGHKCRNMHGHTYRVSVHLFSSDSDMEVGSQAMVVETGLIKTAIMKFDHCDLNEKFAELGYKEETTIEHIAQAIFSEVSAVMPQHVAIQSVRVQEGDGASVTYYDE